MPNRLRSIASYGLFVVNPAADLPEIVREYLALDAGIVPPEYLEIPEAEYVRNERMDNRTQKLESRFPAEHSCNALKERGAFIPFIDYFTKETTAEESSITIVRQRQSNLACDFQVLFSLGAFAALQVRAALNDVLPTKCFVDGWGVGRRAHQAGDDFLSLAKAWFFGEFTWKRLREEKEYSPDELQLVFLDALDRERQKWQRLKNRASSLSVEQTEALREPIPESVRIFVWRRDQGRCVTCGSNERLEFDHIIPLAKGGSNTERNIQLLCEPCNRRKSDCV